MLIADKLITTKKKPVKETRLAYSGGLSIFTQVLVSIPKCTRMVNRARVVIGVPHVNTSTSESA